MPQEMVRLREPNGLLGTRWKVTARYSLQIGPDKRIQCVRVREGVGHVMHFSREEFQRLFEPDKEQTEHEKFIAVLVEQAKAASRSLGPQATKACERPSNYCELPEEEKWAVDRRLGILDWKGTWNT